MVSVPSRRESGVRRLLIIANRNAGTISNLGSNCLREAEEVLRRTHQLEVKLVDGAEVTATAEAGLREGFDAIAAAGGDGTISTVAHVLAGTGVAFGVLPLGTRNHFARDLLGTADLCTALQILAAGNVRAIDVGEVNGHIFINNASIGLYPRLVEEREAQREFAGRPKRTATIIATVKAFVRRPLLRARIEIGGETYERVTPFVFVGNNLYSLNFRGETLREQLDAGDLCVMAARFTSLCSLLAMAWEAWRNRLAFSKRLELWRADAVTVGTRRHHKSVAIDGEVLRMETPLRFRSRPGDLLVVAPER